MNSVFLLFGWLQAQPSLLLTSNCRGKSWIHTFPIVFMQMWTQWPKLRFDLSSPVSMLYTQLLFFSVKIKRITLTMNMIFFHLTTWSTLKTWFLFFISLLIHPKIVVFFYRLDPPQNWFLFPFTVLIHPKYKIVVYFYKLDPPQNMISVSPLQNWSTSITCLLFSYTNFIHPKMWLLSFLDLIHHLNDCFHLQTWSTSSAWLLFSFPDFIWSIYSIFSWSHEKSESTIFSSL